MADKKEIRDAVHGQIDLHPLCVLIVDTPEFQRLRNISQCGLSHLVYPSACHSRFEHSLGVYHLAGLMLKKIEENKQEKIDLADKLCVQIAALCHDLGHGPFSHLWERFLVESQKDQEGGEVNQGVKTPFKHEEMSVEVLKYLIKKNKLIDNFKSYNIDYDKIEFIGRLILGKPDEKDDLDKRYLFEIVNNDETGVDVDRWDYMLRDALHFGVKIELNYDRILSSTTLIKIRSDDGTESRHVAFRDKVARNIKEMFETRTKLHQICYQHSVNKIIEMMLIDALLEFDKYYLVKLRSGDKIKLSKCHENVEAYLKISDYLYYELLNSIDEDFMKGREILERIVNRKLYTLVDAINLDKKDFSQEYKNMIEKELAENFEKKYSFKVGYIDLSTDMKKVNKIICFDKKGDIVQFPEEIKLSGIKVIVVCKDNITKDVQENMKNSFYNILHKAV